MEKTPETAFPGCWRRGPWISLRAELLENVLITTNSNNYPPLFSMGF